MNPEIKKLWVEALRSGEYKQGIKQLKDSNDCFCVLGVLCDLYSKATGTPWGEGNTYMGLKCLPHVRVTRWAGLNHFILAFNRSKVHLITLNDMLGLRFKGLADLIEEQL